MLACIVCGVSDNVRQAPVPHAAVRNGSNKKTLFMPAELTL